MKLFKLLAPMLVLPGLLACDSVETQLQVQGVLAPDDPADCAFDASGSTERLLNIRFDSAGPHLFVLALQVLNNFQSREVQIDRMPEEIWTDSNAVIPLRFDLRWECESSGFSTDLGPIFLPQFAPDKPFCLDRRDDTTGNFVGFDVIPAYGGAIESGGGQGVAEIRPITSQMAVSINDVFGLGILAEQCCSDMMGCDQVAMNTGGFQAGTSCAELSDRFFSVSGGVLQTSSLDDLQKFRPFAIFDGGFYAQNIHSPTVSGSPPSTRSPSYQMRMRGLLEGQFSDGSLVTSQEFGEVIHLCRNCGGSSACTNR